MKTIFALLIFALTTHFAFAQSNNVVIKGSTNVNTFKCRNSNFGTYSFQTSDPSFFQLDVKDFDCGNRMMSNDFKKILKADQYPKMTVKFKSFTKLNESLYSAIIEVKLMDKIKYYSTEFTSNGHYIIGNETVKFSDFNIIPPKKMGGLITVNNNLNLTLTLKKT